MTGDDTRSVLFVCVGNTCRSQMAAAIINNKFSGRWQAISGGTKIEGERDARTRLVLQEIGIEAEVPAATNIKNYNGREFDLIITLADKVREPVAEMFTPTKIVHQHIEDPFRDEDVYSEELQVSRHRQARDEIIEKVIPIIENF